MSSNLPFPEVCLPLWGKWIEISCPPVLHILDFCVFPCGGSGLKFRMNTVFRIIQLCLPLWGKWIEISAWYFHWSYAPCLPLWGKWIEIEVKRMVERLRKGVFPCGGSGLKSIIHHFRSYRVMVSSPVGEVD